MNDKPNDGNRYQWNPYAEAWDLVADSPEDLDLMFDAATAVRNALAEYPGWVGEYFESAISLLENAVTEETDE